MSTHGLLFQWASIIKAHLMALVLYKANSSSTSSSPIHIRVQNLFYIEMKNRDIWIRVSVWMLQTLSKQCFIYIMAIGKYILIIWWCWWTVRFGILTWLDTGTLMKRGGDKLALLVQDWAYQRGNQNSYIEEQTTQWPEEKVQKDKYSLFRYTYTYKSRKSVLHWNEEQRYMN
jgi:hypothetical protein